MRRFCFTTIVVVIFAVTLHAEKKEVTTTVPDGFGLKGTFYSAGIVALSTNTHSKLTMLKGAGHAASMFEKEPDLQADIVIWFRTKLPVSGYAVRPSLK
jgi:hypothetical protein